MCAGARPTLPVWGVAESSREPRRHCPSSSKVRRCPPPSQRVATHIGMACAASKWDFRGVTEWSRDGGPRFVKYMELGQGESNPNTGVFSLSPVPLREATEL